MGLFDKLTGKTRLVVARIILHLSGDEVAPLLGILNQAGFDAIDAEGDIQTIGEGLVTICQHILQLETYWQAAFNEGDVVWSEDEADDFYTELFTDSGQRYLSGGAIEADDDELTIPITQNLIVMMTVVFEGEEAALETNLADLAPLRQGLKALINLHYQERLRAIQVHFSPAALGEELSSDQVLLNFPELAPL
jgi:Protein of unknown function (DUF1517)